MKYIEYITLIMIFGSWRVLDIVIPLTQSRSHIYTEIPKHLDYVLR